MTTTTLVSPERRRLLPASHNDATPVKYNNSSSSNSNNSKSSSKSRHSDAAHSHDAPASAKTIHHGEHEAAATAAAPTTWLQTAQYATSLAILATCVILCMAGIAAHETPVSQASSPVVAGAVMWFLIAWLGVLEGGQGCLVGLQPISPQRYELSHPHTAACARVAHRDGNLNRFIVGRQFLVVLVVFMLNLCCTTVDGAVAPGVPPALLDAVVTSGLAVMLITVMLGQLAAEVNATNCMLDFINTPITVATTYLCLIIEASGLLHAVYLVECFFPATSSDSSESKADAGGCDASVSSSVSSSSGGGSGSGGISLGSGDDDCDVRSSQPPSRMQKAWYWIRVGASVTMLSVAMAVTCAALWHGETTMYPGLDTLASFGLFFGLVCFLGILEALQIAVFAVVKLPAEELEDHPVAQANCALVFRGRNFKAILIGRQICVTTCMFLLARITTTSVDPDDLADTSTTLSTVLGVPAAVQDFFNTGLPGALITTIVASLVWRIVAASFPIYFMSNPIVLVTIRLCLLLEASGVFSAAWLLADGIKWLCRFQPDDEYLSSADDEEKSLATTITRRSSSMDDVSDSESLLEWSTRDASDISV